MHSPDIKRFLGRNYAGLKKPIKKKFLGGEARGFGGFCSFAGEEVALAVRAELGSAGLLSWRQRWCPHQRRRWVKASCSEACNLKRGKVAKWCNSPDIKRFLGRNYAGLKKPMKKKVLRRGGARCWWILHFCG